jgi:hypothetical protein
MKKYKGVHAKQVAKSLTEATIEARKGKKIIESNEIQ